MNLTPTIEATTMDTSTVTRDARLVKAIESGAAIGLHQVKKTTQTQKEEVSMDTYNNSIEQKRRAWLVDKANAFQRLLKSASSALPIFARFQTASAQLTIPVMSLEVRSTELVLQSLSNGEVATISIEWGDLVSLVLFCDGNRKPVFLDSDERTFMPEMVEGSTPLAPAGAFLNDPELDVVVLPSRFFQECTVVRMEREKTSYLQTHLVHAWAA